MGGAGAAHEQGGDAAVLARAEQRRTGHAAEELGDRRLAGGLDLAAADDGRGGGCRVGRLGVAGGGDQHRVLERGELLRTAG